MLPAKKPTKKQARFAASVRRKAEGGKTVKRADLLRALEIETAGMRWRKEQNEAAHAAAR